MEYSKYDYKIIYRMKTLFFISMICVIGNISAETCSEQLEHFDKASDLEAQGVVFFNAVNLTYENVDWYLNQYIFWSLETVHTHSMCDKICVYYLTCRAYYFSNGECELYGNFTVFVENQRTHPMEDIYIDMDRTDNCKYILLSRYMLFTYNIV